MPKQRNIDRLSVVPLFLECLVGSNSLGSGTGFVVEQAGRPFLVTNWHVLSGRDPRTNQPLSENGALPDSLRIWHHVKNSLGTWTRRTELLRNPDGSPRWLEHPPGLAVDVVTFPEGANVVVLPNEHLGQDVDVVALPITRDADIQLYPLDLGLAATDLLLSPSEPVSIVGFPFGMASAGKFPIWKTGNIASDIDLDYDGLPVFLIDATTRPGMSGSPVVARRIGMHRSAQSINLGGGKVTRFLGVYSGSIHDQADIGMVWRPEVLSSILSQMA